MPHRAILLVNLGSPDSPSVPDVRRYLRQFLLDPRVLDVPAPLRWLIVHGFILPFRPRASARAYRAIWSPLGSPLKVWSERVAQALAARIPVPVGLAMRYGRPAIAEALAELGGAAGALERLVLVPLYPHHAMSTTETVAVAVGEAIARTSPGTEVVTVPPFYADPRYIEALVESARGSMEWDHDHLLFSYHGLPERHLRRTDPTSHHCLLVPDCCRTPSPAHATCYRHQVLRTTELFIDRAGLDRRRTSVAFQSRLGRGWLEPFSDREIERLARAGVRRLLVICPAFVSDCLETLEEIGIRGRELFRAAGGDDLRLVPCMNDHPRWIEALASFAHDALDAPSPGLPGNACM